MEGEHGADHCPNLAFHAERTEDFGDLGPLQTFTCRFQLRLFSGRTDGQDGMHQRMRFSGRYERLAYSTMTDSEAIEHNVTKQKKREGARRQAQILPA